MKQVTDAGIQVVAISYDSPEVMKDFATSKKITYPLLSDKGSKVIELYKLRNTEVRKGSRQDGISYPVTVIVNQDGKILKKLTKSVRKRHTTAELIDAIKKK